MHGYIVYNYMCVSMCVYKYLFFIHLFLLFSVNNNNSIHRLPLPYAPYFIRRHAQIEETWIVDTRLLYLEIACANLEFQVRAIFQVRVRQIHLFSMHTVSTKSTLGTPGRELPRMRNYYSPGALNHNRGTIKCGNWH